MWLSSSILNASIAQDDFQQVCSRIGAPVLNDAAQFGSLAHRSRNYWTNLCSSGLLTAALRHVQRPQGRTVDLILQPQRQAQPVTRPDVAPQYPCNVPGLPRAAMPTLMSKRGSYAHRPGQPGSILDSSGPGTVRYDELTAVEREAAMGYLPGSTAAEGVSEQDRNRVLGQCIDANAAQALMAIAKAWWFRRSSANSAYQAGYPTDCSRGSTARFQASGARTGATHSTGHSNPCNSAGNTHHRCGAVQSFHMAGNSSQSSLLAATVSQASSLPCPRLTRAVSLAAEQQESQVSLGKTADIWSDQPVLQLIRNGPTLELRQDADYSRCCRRAKPYYFQGDKLLRRMKDGSVKVVPPPAERESIIQGYHSKLGHYGIRRTAAHVASQYWWYGYWTDVEHVVKRCEHCSRVNASFTAKPQELTSIPISSAGFRWHVDLAGPLPVTERGNRFVMVAVEAFTKHMEAIPMPNKEASTITYHFLHNVLSRYGAPGQVITDEGTEFKGAFAQLLEDSMVDHRIISRDHPQSNGQAEKAVGIVKQSLRKMCADRHSVHDWDMQVPWLVLGYRCSPQRSTGFTPYELLYARAPVLPPAVKEAFSRQLDLDNPDQASQDLLARRNKLQKMTPMALENLAIAQHRDQLRYLRVRSADYQPRLQHFHPGQFVYVQQLQQHSTLQPRAQRLICQVVAVKDTGVLTLQGKCGRTMSLHMSHCTPCHLPNIDGTIDPRLAEDVEATVCEVCGTDDKEDLLLLCDICACGYHTYCLQPPLAAVPDGTWLCPTCVKAGYTEADVTVRAEQREGAELQASAPNLYPDTATKKRDQAAAALHGRLVHQPFKDPVTGATKKYWGRVAYRGPLFRPEYFMVTYEDGDSQTMTSRRLKAWLQQEGTQPPVGVSIPTAQVTMLASTSESSQRQAMYTASYGRSVATPCVPVPAVDLAKLRSILQLSLAQAVCDPITHNQQWSQAGLTRLEVTGNKPTQAATVIMISPIKQALMSAVHQAITMRPACIVCYVPTLQLPTALGQMLKALTAQGSAVSVRALYGWWIIISRAPLKIQQWLR